MSNLAPTIRHFRNVGGAPGLEYFVAASAYLLFAVIGSAWVLLQPGTLGHHWDWVIPASPEELRKLAATNLYAWQDFALGSFVSYRYTTTLMAMLLGIPGFLGLSGAFVTKTLVVGSLAGSAFSMYLLARAILRDFQISVYEHRYALVAGVLYGFSPFAYNQIVAGDQLETISYALAPLVILLILRATSEENPRRFLAVVSAAALTAIMSASPQTAAITVAVALCLVLVAKRPWRSAVRGVGAFVSLATLLCAYWILPVALGGEAVVEGLATTPQLFADSSFRMMGNLFQSMTTAAEPGLFYFRALSGPTYWAFTAAWITIWGIVLVALVRKTRHRITVGLAAIYIGGSLLPLGGAPIIGPVILAVFKATQPASLLFRTAQHLIFLPTLVVGLLAAVAAAELRILDQRKYRILAVFCVVAISSGFITHSNYLGLIGPFQVSVTEQSATRYVASHGGNGRLLFVPTAGGFYYHPGVFDYYFEGGDDGSVRFSPLPTIAPSFKWSPYHNGQVVQKALDELMTQPGRENEQRLLTSLTSVRFVEARAGVVPMGGVFVNQFDFGKAIKSFDKLHFLRPVTRDNHTALWVIAKPVSRIYTPDCTVGVDPSADPYDLLAWADEVTGCSAPAFIAGPATEEVIVHAWDVKTPNVGVGTVMRFGHEAAPFDMVPVPGGPNAVVRVNAGGAVTADPQNQPYYVILCRIRPHRAFSTADEGNSPHILMQIAVPESGPYLISFLAPDWDNRFDVRAALHRGSQVVKFDLARLGGTGHARIGNITQLRIANVDPRLFYFGTVDIGPIYEYFAGWDSQFGTAEGLETPPYAHGNVVAANWWGSNSQASLTVDGGASILAQAPYFVLESDLTGTEGLSSRSNEQLRIYFTINTPYAGKYLVSLLAPDWDHRFDLTVALPAGPSSTSFSPLLTARFGNPQVDAIRRIRIANVLAFPRSAQITIRPPVAYHVPIPQAGGTPETVAQPTWNRWDMYYFGDLQHRLALRNTLTYRVRGLSAAFTVPWSMRYRLYMRLQTGATYMPFAVSVDGGLPRCIDTSLHIDRTEDLVLAAEPTLASGRHGVHIQPCSGTAVAGDLAIVSLDVVPSVPISPAPNVSSIAKLKEVPGKFTVTISGSRSTYLVFNDAYDPRWIAKQRGRVIDHLHANGYANAWLVEEPGDGPIEISFQPQAFLNAGYLVSALSFVGLMGFAVVQALWRRFTV